MGSERAQATVEWIGLLLLIALVLVAVGHLASRADGHELGATLAHSVTHPGRPAASGAPVPSRRPAHAPARRRPAPVRPRSAPPPARLRRAQQDLARDLLRRAGRAGVRRGAGALWRRAWFACLVYERVRYAIRHPESRRPDYTFPYDVALRIVNGCAVPVDLLGDIPELNPAP